MQKRAIVLFLIALLSGCSTVDQWMYQGYAIAPLNANALDGYNAMVHSLTNPVDGTPLVDKSCFGVPSDSGNSCRAARDQAVSALVIGSEELCLRHRQSIYGRDAGWNIATGTLTSLFAGAAAVVDSERRKSILSALALFTNAERSLVNETVYKQMIVPSVDKKIVEIRESKLTIIYDGLKKPISEYGMHQALRDVVAYHQSCSFMTGLQKALDEGTQGTNSQKILRLRANMASVTAEMDGLKNATDDASKTRLAHLKERLAALSDALKTLETQ